MVIHNDVPAVDYLLIGHLTADLTPEGRLPGGTVSYAARTIHAFGMRVGLLTSAVPDEPLLDELRQWATVVSIPAQATTTFENLYTPAGRVQYIRGVAAPITPDDIPAVWRNTPLIHIGPIADEIQPQVAGAFPESAILITLQGWLRRWEADERVRFKRWFNAEVLKTVDFIVFSEEDIVEAPEMEAEIAQAARSLILTRADKGGTIYSEGEPSQYEASPVEVINPTGAGDVFASSFLAAWHLLNHDVDHAIRVAAELAAHSVTRIGLQSAPTPDEVRAAMNR